LIPVEAHAPCPTAAQLAALFEKGLGKPLPSLRQVEGDPPGYFVTDGRLDFQAVDLGSATQIFAAD
jgi:hypothetical protein